MENEWRVELEWDRAGHGDGVLGPWRPRRGLRGGAGQGGAAVGLGIFLIWGGKGGGARYPIVRECPPGGAKLRANGGFGSGEGGICRGGAGQMPSEVGGEVARGWAVGGGKGLAGDGRRVGGALVRGLRPTL